MSIYSQNNLIAVVDKQSSNYEEARRISNLRLNLKPDKIAYCQTASEIQQVIEYCIANQKAFKIRSGGHHHEGACSGNDVIIIDTSRMNKITISECGERAVIQPGAKLSDVYRTLKNAHKILPGGGCESVNIGGLVQGGGWGPYSRSLGMTCDTLVEAEIVLANGTINTVNEQTDPKLFKALKGSGGGNFGVITSLTFQLYDIADKDIVTFELSFKDTEVSKRRLLEWSNNASKADNSITSFSRVYPDNHMSGLKLFISGIILTDTTQNTDDYKKSIATIFGLNSLEESGYSDLKISVENYSSSGNNLRLSYFDGNSSESNTNEINHTNNLEFEHPIHFGTFSNESKIGDGFSFEVPNVPSSTCDAPHPHKISSFFPKLNCDYGYLMELIFNYMDTPVSSKVNSYLSFHGMGGRIQEGDNYFYYKDRDFMFQIQSWWSDPRDHATKIHLQWVENLRLTLLQADMTEGSFVNFPDYNSIKQVSGGEPYNPNDDNDRITLLTQYYGLENLEQLIEAKKEYDPTDVFIHEMSLKSILKIK